jgi:hypothetical protein
MDISFYNIFINTHINTNYFDIKCIFDSADINSWIKKHDHLTHSWVLKWNYAKNSVLRGEWSILDDIWLLLSVALWNQVFSDSFNLWRIGANKNDFSLLMQDDIELFINKSISQLEWMSPEYQNIFKNAILMYYQTKYFLWFDDLKDILFMNCFEFIIMSIYRIDKSIPDDQGIEFSPAYTYLITKFNYQEYLDEKLLWEIGWESLKDFKKRMQLKKFSSFEKQFRDMRNWIAHGKNHKKPVFAISPSNVEFTFEYKLESFIRIVLIDLIYTQDYKRKFDVLYQLILEKNVMIMVHPEFPKLRFVNS